MEFKLFDLSTRRSRQYTFLEGCWEYGSLSLSLFRAVQHNYSQGSPYVDWIWRGFQVVYYGRSHLQTIRADVWILNRQFQFRRKVEPTDELPF